MMVQLLNQVVQVQSNIQMKFNAVIQRLSQATQTPHLPGSSLAEASTLVQQLASQVIQTMADASWLGNHSLAAHQLP